MNRASANAPRSVPKRRAAIKCDKFLKEISAELIEDSKHKKTATRGDLAEPRVVPVPSASRNRSKRIGKPRARSANDTAGERNTRSVRVLPQRKSAKICKQLLKKIAKDLMQPESEYDDTLPIEDVNGEEHEDDRPSASCSGVPEHREDTATSRSKCNDNKTTTRSISQKSRNVVDSPKASTSSVTLSPDRLMESGVESGNDTDFSTESNETAKRSHAKHGEENQLSEAKPAEDISNPSEKDMPTSDASKSSPSTSKAGSFRHIPHLDILMESGVESGDETDSDFVLEQNKSILNVNGDIDDVKTLDEEVLTVEEESDTTLVEEDCKITSELPTATEEKLDIDSALSMVSIEEPLSPVDESADEDSQSQPPVLASTQDDAYPCMESKVESNNENGEKQEVTGNSEKINDKLSSDNSLMELEIQSSDNTSNGQGQILESVECEQQPSSDLLTNEVFPLDAEDEEDSNQNDTIAEENPSQELTRNTQDQLDQVEHAEDKPEELNDEHSLESDIICNQDDNTQLSPDRQIGEDIQMAPKDGKQLIDNDPIVDFWETLTSPPSISLLPNDFDVWTEEMDSPEIKLDHEKRKKNIEPEFKFNNSNFEDQLNSVMELFSDLHAVKDFPMDHSQRSNSPALLPKFQDNLQCFRESTPRVETWNELFASDLKFENLHIEEGGNAIETTPHTQEPASDMDIDFLMAPEDNDDPKNEELLPRLPSPLEITQDIPNLFPELIWNPDTALHQEYRGELFSSFEDLNFLTEPEDRTKTVQNDLYDDHSQKSIPAINTIRNDLDFWTESYWNETCNESDDILMTLAPEPDNNNANGEDLLENSMLSLSINPSHDQGNLQMAPMLESSDAREVDESYNIPSSKDAVTDVSDKMMLESGNHNDEIQGMINEDVTFEDNSIFSLTIYPSNDEGNFQMVPMLGNSDAREVDELYNIPSSKDAVTDVSDKMMLESGNHKDEIQGMINEDVAFEENFFLNAQVNLDFPMEPEEIINLIEDDSDNDEEHYQGSMLTEQISTTQDDPNLFGLMKYHTPETDHMLDETMIKSEIKLENDADNECLDPENFDQYDDGEHETPFSPICYYDKNLVENISIKPVVGLTSYDRVANFRDIEKLLEYIKVSFPVGTPRDVIFEILEQEFKPAPHLNQNFSSTKKPANECENDDETLQFHRSMSPADKSNVVENLQMELKNILFGKASTEESPLPAIKEDLSELESDKKADQEFSSYVNPDIKMETEDKNAYVELNSSNGENETLHFKINIWNELLDDTLFKNAADTAEHESNNPPSFDQEVKSESDIAIKDTNTLPEKSRDSTKVLENHHKIRKSRGSVQNSLQKSLPTVSSYHSGRTRSRNSWMKSIELEENSNHQSPRKDISVGLKEEGSIKKPIPVTSIPQLCDSFDEMASLQSVVKTERFVGDHDQILRVTISATEVPVIYEKRPVVNSPIQTIQDDQDIDKNSSMVEDFPPSATSDETLMKVTKERTRSSVDVYHGRYLDNSFQKFLSPPRFEVVHADLSLGLSTEVSVEGESPIPDGIEVMQNYVESMPSVWVTPNGIHSLEGKNELLHSEHKSKKPSLDQGIKSTNVSGKDRYELPQTIPEKAHGIGKNLKLYAKTKGSVQKSHQRSLPTVSCHSSGETRGRNIPMKSVKHGKNLNHGSSRKHISIGSRGKDRPQRFDNFENVASPQTPIGKSVGKPILTIQNDKQPPEMENFQPSADSNVSWMKVQEENTKLLAGIHDGEYLDNGFNNFMSEPCLEVANFDLGLGLSMDISEEGEPFIPDYSIDGDVCMESRMGTFYHHDQDMI